MASSTNQDDVAFSAGGGGGILIRLHERAQGSTGPGLRAVFIDLRGRYLSGSEADYLKKGSIRRENGRVTFDRLRSRTDLATAMAGVSLQF